MASYTHIFQNEETTNWFKACIALNITKKGLSSFVDQEIQKVHTAVGKGCGSCSMDNLIKQKQRCPTGFCNQVQTKIEIQHRFRRPSWQNTKVQQWATDHWEIAKCFCPPDGYLNVRSVQKTDFNGVISIMSNCVHFDTCVSFNISPKPPTPPCILTKARQIGRDVRHTSDCKVTDVVLQDYFQTLTTLLTDSTFLAQDRSASQAVTKLLQLQTDRLAITQTELSALLQDAKTSLEESQQISVEAGKNISQELIRALVQIKGALTHCLLVIDERTQRGIARIASAEQDAITHIAQVSVNCEKENLESKEKEFLQQLIEHYETNLSFVPLSPLVTSNDRNIRDFYIPPKVIVVSKNATHVDSYRDMFFRGETLHRRLYLLGEPGVGKSTFVTRLVLDWASKTILTDTQETSFYDVDTLQDFHFVFFVTLRDTPHQREVVAMIKEQIIDIILTEENRENAYTILQHIMKQRKCLVVLDGLDEWADPNGKLAVPLLASIHSQCTLLIATRPWKMTDERIKDSQIDITLEVEGIGDPFMLSDMIIGCIVHTGVNEKRAKFRRMYKRETMDVRPPILLDVLRFPMMIALIVCVWLDGIHLEGSLAEIYSLMLDCLLKKVNFKQSCGNPWAFYCFRKTKYLQQNIDALKALSRAAFFLLFSDRQWSVVFSGEKVLQYLSSEQKAFALSAGVLSERKRPSFIVRESELSFVHKSMQEFLSAIYIAIQPSAINDVISTYFEKHTNARKDVSLVFKFLCGLNIDAAYKLSFLMNEHYNYDPLDHGFRDLILAGFKEAKLNKQSTNNVCLYITDFNFRDGNFLIMPKTDVDDLTFLLLKNKSNVRSVEFSYRSNELSIADLNDILLSSAHCLENLHIQGTFRVCPKIENKVEVLSTLLKSKLPRLKSLTLHSEVTSSLFADIPISPVIECIDVGNMSFSSTSLRNMLVKLLALNHPVTCKVNAIHVISDEEVLTRSSKKTTFYQKKSADKATDITLECFGCSQGLYEAVRGMPIKHLTIKGITHSKLLFQTLLTLTDLQDLNISTMDLCDEAYVPHSVHQITLAPIMCSFTSLIHLFEQLLKFHHPVKCLLDVFYIHGHTMPLVPLCHSTKQYEYSRRQRQNCTPDLLCKNEIYGRMRCVINILESKTTDFHARHMFLKNPYFERLPIESKLISLQDDLQNVYNFIQYTGINYHVIYICKTSREKSLVSSTTIYTQISESKNMCEMSSFRLRCNQEDSLQLIDALHHVQIYVRCLTVVGVENIELISHKLSAFTEMTKLRILSYKLCFTSSLLRSILWNLSKFMQIIDCLIVFPLEESLEYLPVKEELEELENVKCIEVGTKTGRFFDYYMEDNDSSIDNHSMIMKDNWSTECLYVNIALRFNG
ncbi:hypothetical protein DPMN_192298 [Dreissena polymorpha]|uniref:NACHT domain-containing protein n=1 Tax=Dreissena polymorpha TaxID=45954 RepID=A0A9D3Y0M4_DREPO|nr:hypothetical protein DPMN_192298 [Dreissena polymorpha]